MGTSFQSRVSAFVSGLCEGARVVPEEGDVEPSIVLLLLLSSLLIFSTSGTGPALWLFNGIF